MTWQNAPAFLLALPLLVGARFLFVGHPTHSADAIFAGILSALAILLYGQTQKSPLLKGALFVAALSLCASTIFSVQPLMSLLSLSGIVSFVAAFVIAQAAQGTAHHRIRLGLLVGACLHSIVAIYQTYWSWPALLAQSESLGLSPSIVNRLQLGRPLGLSLSPDLAGALAMTGVFIAGAFLVERRQQFKNSSTQNAPLTAALFASLLLCFFALILSKSAGTYLAFAVGLALVAFLSLRHWSFRLLAIMAATGAASLFIFVGRGFSGLSTSAHERLLNWQAATEMGQSLFGVGLYRFAPVYLAERGPETNVTRYAHSAFFQWFAEGGLLGILALALGGVVFVRFVYQGRHRVNLWILGLCTALLLRSTYDYDLQIAQTITVFGFCLGLLCAPLSPNTQSPKSISTARKIAVLLVVIVFGLLTTTLQLRETILEGAAGKTITSRYLKTLSGDDRISSYFIKQLSPCSGGDCEAFHAHALALTQERLNKPYPPVALALYAAARAANAGQKDVAQAAYQKALDANPQDAALRSFVQRQLKALDP